MTIEELVGIEPFVMTAETALRQMLQNKDGKYYSENEWSNLKNEQNLMFTISAMEVYANLKVTEALANQLPPEPC